MKIKFSLLITTKNRLEDLKITLDKIEYLLDSKEVECIVYDDASSDGTSLFLNEKYPKIKVYKNDKSKGYIYNRNFLLDKCNGIYAISLDDDANFIDGEVLYEIDKYFLENLNCGLLAFRIFWGKNNPFSTKTDEKQERVKGFVGCGHVWRMKAWREIPNYPEWFVFYGEEDFASYQLFKNKIEVHYVPEILVHHRADIKARKKEKDYIQRTRRSLRSGWYLFLMFHPWSVIPKQLSYSLWMQIKNKTLKGDLKATFGILQAIGDVILNFPKLLEQSNRLNLKEYIEYKNLKNTVLYWKPKDEK